MAGSPAIAGLVRLQRQHAPLAWTSCALDPLLAVLRFAGLSILLSAASLMRPGVLLAGYCRCEQCLCVRPQKMVTAGPVLTSLTTMHTLKRLCTAHQKMGRLVINPTVPKECIDDPFTESQTRNSVNGSSIHCFGSEEAADGRPAQLWPYCLTS